MNEKLHSALTDIGEEAHKIFTCQLNWTPNMCAGPLAGLWISVKDNIDVGGITTTAGSVAFRSLAPAASDAPIVARLNAAGATVFAKTNMDEFAYSPHGVNPNYGTPSNPQYPMDEPHIPGGSSSGAAVAVARGLGDAAIGTDTAGSARIPAALCGVVGLKPRQHRIPREGIVPVVRSYDCVGVLAKSVAPVARVFGAIANHFADRPPRRAAAGGRYRILVPTRESSGTSSAVNEPVAEAFSAAVARLAASSDFEVVHRPLPVYREASTIVAGGGLTSREAYSFHKAYFPTLGHLYDPPTLRRLALGEACSDEHYRDLLERRRQLISAAAFELESVDAVVQPTCPITAPPVAALCTLEARTATSFRLIEHTMPANVLDLASITLPCGHLARTRRSPVGMLLDTWYSEEVLLELAAAVEGLLSS